MGTEKVKVYEEQKRKGLSIWVWLLPILLILGILAWALTRNHRSEVAAVPVTENALPAAGALPALGTVHFDTDKATLTAEGQATLTRAAEVMKERPHIRLRLDGYTDSTGSATHNDALSQQRAATVESFLQAKGIPKSRLTGEGFGQANPAGNNATVQGKADNRRVELFEESR